MKKVTINFIMSMAVVVLMFVLIVVSEVVSGKTSNSFGDLIGIVIYVLEILIGGYALLLLILAIVARAVFSKQGKGLLAYRILMGIEYILQGGIVLFCINVMSVSWNILAALVAAGIVYGGINTYTERILD